MLRLRLTDVPGWHASIDGRPVPLQSFAGVMLQIEVPAGRHTIELYYWPATFTAGLVLAGCAVVGLAGAVARRLGPPPATPRCVGRHEQPDGESSTARLRAEHSGDGQSTDPRRFSDGRLLVPCLAGGFDGGGRRFRHGQSRNGAGVRRPA